MEDEHVALDTFHETVAAESVEMARLVKARRTRAP
jgi:hypothetical protein